MSLVTTLVAGAYLLVAGDGDIVPSWPSAGWLITLALTSQVLGWLLITTSLPRLPAAMTSLTLTIQPIGSVALGAILLRQDPSALQLAGVACILAGLLSVAVRRRARVYARRRVDRQPRAAAVQAAHHGPDRDPQRLGRLLVAEAGDVDGRDDVALVGREIARSRRSPRAWR